MKSSIIFIATMLSTLVACKKDYTCSCDSNVDTVYYEDGQEVDLNSQDVFSNTTMTITERKSKAEAECEGYSTTTTQTYSYGDNDYMEQTVVTSCELQ